VKPQLKTFKLERKEDESGVSGTGTVAQGVVFDNGKVALTWNEDVTDVDASSIGVYDSIEDVEKIHGHNGKTEVVFDNTMTLEADIDVNLEEIKELREQLERIKELREELDSLDEKEKDDDDFPDLTPEPHNPYRPYYPPHDPVKYPKFWC